jgi:hypothetical protein
MLALVGDLARVLEILRDEWDAKRVARHQGDSADFARRDPDVELPPAQADATLVDDAHADSNDDLGRMDASILAAPARIAVRSSAGLLIALVLAGCGDPSPSAIESGPGGFVAVDIDQSVVQGQQPFEPIHRARLIAIDGSLAAEWQLTQAAAPVRVQPGVYRLDAFTVFLGDTLECVADPVAPGGQRCTQPTLGPGQICALDVVVVTEQTTRATYHVLRDGACGLEAGEAPAAT